MLWSFWSFFLTFWFSLAYDRSRIEWTKPFTNHCWDRYIWTRRLKESWIFSRAKTFLEGKGDNNGGGRSTYLLSTSCNIHWSYSLARTSISSRDLPLLRETIGGSLNISPSSGYCWIKGHFCKTVDKIRFISLHLCRRASFLSSNLIFESVVIIGVSRYPRSTSFALNFRFFPEELSTL